MTPAALESTATALEAFDRNRTILAREVADLQRRRSEASDALDELLVKEMTGAKAQPGDRSRLEKVIAEADRELPSKLHQLALTDEKRPELARPLAEAEFDRLAAERDELTRQHAAALEELEAGLEKLIAAQERIARLEDADQRLRAAQDRAVDAGGLRLHSLSALSQGVLSAHPAGLLEQVRYALIFNQHRN